MRCSFFFFSRSFSSNAGSEAKGPHVINVRLEIVGAKGCGQGGGQEAKIEV
jgi:hypothetical protein